jgi:nitrogen PTS system EIIA component
MYYIPDSEKNYYLKEISGLAKVVSTLDVETSFANIKDIHTIRDKLLDWIGAVVNDAVPDSKAKMIKLDTRQAAADSKIKESISPMILQKIIPFNLLMLDNEKFLIL